MKKIIAILNGKINEQLIDVQVKKIHTGIDCAILNAQEQGLDAKLEQERLLQQIGDPKQEMYYILENMKLQEDTIRASEEMVEFLKRVQVDLNKEVEIEPEK